MATTYRIHHVTRYQYSESVAISHNLLHLSPRNQPSQTCYKHTLTIDPVPAVASRTLDYFSNHVAFFTVQELHRAMTITADSEVQVRPPDQPNPQISLPWEQVRQLLLTDRSAQGLDARQFTLASTHIAFSDDLRAYAQPSFPPGRPLLQAVLDLTQRIYRDFRYDTGVTNVATPIAQVLDTRRGVCQDFAHLQIAMLRSLGLAARYISGYLLTQPPPGQPRLVGADASHAWLAVFCPGMGWVEFDPTNNQIPSGKHIVLAWGRDYADVSPVRGVILGGGGHTMAVSVDVLPL